MISSYIKKQKHILFYFFLFIYFIVNILLLTKYPYIHSDESWLSGLSRTILENKSFNTIEPFFDIYPRAVHGLRVVFVSIQIFFIQIFGYSIFSMRAISLLFTILSLIVIYKILFKTNKISKYSLIFLIGISTSIHFIMTGHIARQEPIILFTMLLSYYMIFKKNDYNKPLTISLASIIGLSIGVHPNSFLIACGIGTILLFKWINKDIKFIEIIKFIFILFIIAISFIGLSIIINPNFIKDYLAFGTSLGVFDHSIGRVLGFFYYYKKLFLQIGGTYNLVDIRFDLILLFLSFLYSTIYTLKTLLKRIKKLDIQYNTNIIYSYLMILGINIGYIIIGRYNQTSIIFTLIFAYINIFSIITHLFLRDNKKSKLILISLLLFFLGFQTFNTYNTISNTRYEDYSNLNYKLDSIPSDANVLANLNLDYHFDNKKLFDYRNLYYLQDNNLSFSDYIDKNHIEYIVFYEEMEYIYNSNNKWDILYGDLYYYDDMITFLDLKCILVDEFKNPTYGMRIAKYVDVYPWYTRIYKIQED